jgi:hypothetical protein
MSLTWYNLQKQFNAQIHADDFDLEKAVACRFDFGERASMRDILGLAIHDSLIGEPGAKPVNIAVNRSLEVLAECAPRDLFKANFLIANGGLADPEVLERLCGASGPLAVDVQELNCGPERKVSMNLEWKGDCHFNPKSVRLVAEHLWDWVDYQYSLRDALARSRSAPIVGELLGFKPISEFCANSTFSREALEHPAVLAMILRNGHFENGQQGQALRASILSGDRATVEGMTQLICKGVTALRDDYRIRSEAEVFQSLLKTYFPGGEGADPALLRLANRSFERILDDSALQIG